MTNLAAVGTLERFRAIIASRLGLSFDESKLGFLEEVLGRRVEGRRHASQTYLDALESAPDAVELQVLAEELTIGETYFFRNTPQFQAFSEIVLPDRMQVRRTAQGQAVGPMPLRFLSAGCSSGEEAYSIAIAARARVPATEYDVAIHAVDINRGALARARTARYSPWALRETPEDIQERWFRREGRLLHLADSIRESVTFAERNLTHAQAELWRPDTYDAIFCRNVIMYLTPEAARGLVDRMRAALVVGGYLFVGHAETLRGLSQRFHLCHTHETFYYQRCESAEKARRPYFARGAAPTDPAGARPLGAPAGAEWASETALSSLVHDSDSWVDTIRKASERIEQLSAHASASSALSPSPAAPARIPATWDLGRALELLRFERFADALELLHGLPVESGEDPEVLLLRGVLLSQSARFESAEAVCRRLLAHDELSAGAHYLLATCREGVGDRAGAIDEDRLAVHLDASFAMPRLHLGLMARRSGDRAQAAQELSEALLLLEREEASRLLLFGGGFSRQALVDLCAAEISACRAGEPIP